MRKLCLILFALLLWTHGAQSKVYWLPDYLGENVDRNDDRTNSNDPDKGGIDGGKVDSSCSNLGMLNKSQIGNKTCKFEVFPNIGTCYYDCVCPPRFSYASCSDGKILAGDECDGKYESCICNPSHYPYTSCPSGYVLSGEKCSDTQTHYTSCKNLCDNREAVPAPFGCMQFFADCPSKCEQAYPDNCHNREPAPAPYDCQQFFADCPTECEIPYPDNCRNRNDNETDFGCDKYWQDCPTKCETGTICSPNDCSGFTLTTAPANASYESCTPGCGNDVTKYKLTQCNSGYWSLDSFLCTNNQLCYWKIN